MSEESNKDYLAKQMRGPWFQYLDTVGSFRPELHRYCRRITTNVWDAEDLLQETLLRGFGAIGRGDLHRDASRVSNPRAYLFRTATNIWIDSVRRNRSQREENDEGAMKANSAAEESIATRQAGSALFAAAAPRERAAVLLKDVFDFTLEEISEHLSTTVGAVKAALHRGRSRR